MSDYIDRDELIKHVKDLPTWWEDGGGVYGPPMKYPEGLFYPEDVIASIENAPVVDVSEIVRCKDCKNYELMKANNHHFCNEFGGLVTEKDFCSRAQKNGRR